MGNQPYSNKCSARDSWFMAIFTFGEGYHNYHHEFQHDYRNGVKWWQWDPTKWTIWTLEKLHMVEGLRRVPEDKILLAQLADARRRLGEQLACPKVSANARLHELLRGSDTKLHELGERWTALKAQYAEKAGAMRAEYTERATAQFDEAREALTEMRRELRQALRLLEHAGAMA